jgi:hypothetical protein
MCEFIKILYMCSGWCDIWVHDQDLRNVLFAISVPLVTLYDYGRSWTTLLVNEQKNLFHLSESLVQLIHLYLKAIAMLTDNGIKTFGHKAHSIFTNAEYLLWIFWKTLKKDSRYLQKNQIYLVTFRLKRLKLFLFSECNKSRYDMNYYFFAFG